MSDSSMLARPASALRYSPTNLGDQPDAFSLLSGVATAAYDATFSQGEDYSTISQPRAELRPTLSPYITERQPSLPAQNLADPYHMAQMQQTHHHHHAPQPLLSSAQTYGASSLGQGSWWNAANFGWPGRAPWPAPGHENISSFMTRCPPIIIDSEQQRPASEVSSESSLGSLPPEEQDPYHVSSLPTLCTRTCFLTFTNDVVSRTDATARCTP